MTQARLSINLNPGYLSHRGWEPGTRSGAGRLRAYAAGRGSPAAPNRCSLVATAACHAARGVGNVQEGVAALIARPSNGLGRTRDAVRGGLGVTPGADCAIAHRGTSPSQPSGFDARSLASPPHSEAPPSPPCWSFRYGVTWFARCPPLLFPLFLPLSSPPIGHGALHG